MEDLVEITVTLSEADWQVVLMVLKSRLESFEHINRVGYLRLKPIHGKLHEQLAQLDVPLEQMG